MGETTAVEARKGNNWKVVKRHVDSVISLLAPNLSRGANRTRNSPVSSDQLQKQIRPKRAAVVACESAFSHLIADNRIYSLLNSGW